MEFLREKICMELIYQTGLSLSWPRVAGSYQPPNWSELIYSDPALVPGRKVKSLFQLAPPDLNPSFALNLHLQSIRQRLWLELPSVDVYILVYRLSQPEKVTHICNLSVGPINSWVWLGARHAMICMEDLAINLTWPPPARAAPDPTYPTSQDQEQWKLGNSATVETPKTIREPKLKVAPSALWTGLFLTCNWLLSCCCWSCDCGPLGRIWCWLGIKCS